MADYHAIEHHCRQQAELSRKLIDEFLIYYCAEREDLEQLFTEKLRKYHSIVKTMPKDWPLCIMSQYVAFRLFRKDGFASRYLRHSRIRSRSGDEQDLMRFQVDNPWKFTFCTIHDIPAPHFYIMEDVLTNESFLLYSTGLTEMLAKYGPKPMFFYLIGFNGQCWQTYGPHVYFRGFIPSDLLFFAQQMDPRILFMNQIPDLVIKDPLPFMALFAHAEVPFAYHGNDMVLINNSEYHVGVFEPSNYTELFSLSRNTPIHKLALKRWSGFPHFATGYYHAGKNRLFLSALTDRGYGKLIESFSRLGYDLPESPDLRITLNMLHAIKEILGKKVDLNPYDQAFSEPANIGEQK